MSIPGDIDREELHESQHAIRELERLVLAGYDEADLRGDAEHLLWSAHKDPMLGWWPLIRHSREAGWKRLKGPSAHHAAQRIAAEVLLRAHEELAVEGRLTNLPAEGSSEAGVLSDRVGRRHDGAHSLERELGRLGLSPHPRVLLLVEGVTEVYHFERLLEAVGLGRSDLVRLQSAGGVTIDPGLVTRYAIGPRILEDRDGSQTLHSHPTALIVAMDPEGKRWATPEAQARTRRVLQSAVREQVAAQLDGKGTVGQKELDFLVSVHVWGESYFELAHFNDDELAQGLKELAVLQGVDVDSDWIGLAEQAIAATRSRHLNLDHSFRSLGLRQDKPRLAAILHPILMHKVEGQIKLEMPDLPILRVLRDVQEKVSILSSPGYYILGADDQNGGLHSSDKHERARVPARGIAN